MLLLDDSIELMDTHSEVFIVFGKNVGKKERKDKCRAAIKAFFAAKGDRLDLMQKVAITFYNRDCKAYAAMKYLAL